MASCSERSELHRSQPDLPLDFDFSNHLTLSASAASLPAWNIPEILEIVFSHLPPAEFEKLALVSRQWRKIVCDPQFLDKQIKKSSLSELEDFSVNSGNYKVRIPLIIKRWSDLLTLMTDTQIAAATIPYRWKNDPLFAEELPNIQNIFTNSVANALESVGESYFDELEDAMTLYPSNSSDVEYSSDFYCAFCDLFKQRTFRNLAITSSSLGNEALIAISQRLSVNPKPIACLRVYGDYSDEGLNYLLRSVSTFFDLRNGECRLELLAKNCSQATKSQFNTIQTGLALGGHLLLKAQSIIYA